jgi:NADH:ubiquinone oxidoreductase subunit F (NADH-binding)
VRAEYPLAVHRLSAPSSRPAAYGVLGDNILGRGFNFDIELVEGAGAFVCGEETALIASLEGTPAGRGRARRSRAEGPVRQADQHQQRRDLVQRRAHRLQGPGLVQETGSAKSAGTKVFSLVGKVKNTGLVEMPLGTPLKTFIYDIGGGAAPAAARSRPCRPAAPPAAASRRRCSTRRWTTRRWRSSAPSWARAAWW